MIECPRCGFSQPKDQYCANCGVNMETYKPDPDPIHIRLLNSPAFYISAMFLLVFALAFYISTQPNSTLARTAKRIVPIGGKAEPIAISANENSPVPSTPPPPRETQVKPAAKAVSFTQESRRAEEENSSESSEKIVEESPLEQKVPENITVSFAEVSVSTLSFLSSKAQILSESSDMQSMLIEGHPNLNELGSEDDGERILVELPGQKSESLEAGSNYNFNYTYLSEDGQEEYGMNMQITVSTLSAESTGIELDAFINIPGTENSEGINTTVGGTYTLTNSKSLVITGLIPRIKIDDEILANIDSTPLSILASESFTNADSETPAEFLIYIQVK